MDVLRRGAALAAILVGLLACQPPERHRAHGVVENVSQEHGQVLVAHDDIPGLMPAMTMNFTVSDPALLAALRPGLEIDFELERHGHVWRIVEAEVVGEVAAREGWARLGDDWVRSDPAPDFRLIDQAGEPLALSDLRGRAVLLDFIFTRCPGPCPIQTGVHASVQRALPDGVRRRSQLVSISLDPAYDTPAVLAEYARRRGADLTRGDWSFLTGPPDEVEAVVKAFGVGTLRRPDGDIEHLLVSFLLDGEGRIVKRYLAGSQDPEQMARDLVALVSGSDDP